MRLIPLLAALLLILTGCSGKSIHMATSATEPSMIAQPSAENAAVVETTTAATAEKPVITTDAGPFNAADLVCNDMSSGCSYDMAQNWFGFAPDSVQDALDLEGNPIRKMSYGGCTLTFTGENFTLSEAQFNDATLAGPRSLAVGHTLTDIESVFGLGGEGQPYYEAEGGLAPRAERLQFEGDTTYLVLLTAPLAPYDEETLSQELAWMDQPHAQLVYTLDAQTDTILSIHWILAPLSENR